MSGNSYYDRILRIARSYFGRIEDHRQAKKVKIPLSDHLMSALGIFALKFPSLLKFDDLVRNAPESAEAHNFRTLFGVEKPPDDTSMRQTLDEVAPSELKGVFKDVFTEIYRSKALEKFLFYRGSYLLAIDGTGFFSSHEVHCDSCCVKNHRAGTTTYYHQMLAVAMIHPDIVNDLPKPPDSDLHAA